MGLAIPDAMDVEPKATGDNMTARKTFSPDFNLALIVGPEKERILVSSVVLRLASPVFAAMLSPPWLESQGLSTASGSTKEIELPEDDATALKSICAVLHHQNDDKILKAVASRVFLNIAILTDKYDFHIALKFVLLSIMNAATHVGPLQNWTPRSELRDVGFATIDLQKRQLLTWHDLLNLAAAGYLLNDCKFFSKNAFDLMTIQRHSFATLLLDDLVSGVLPPRFAIKLGERASEFRLKVIKDIQERLNRDSPYNRCSCHARISITERFENFVVHFDDTVDGLRRPLASILYDLDDLAHEDMLFLQAECSDGGEPHIVDFPEDFVALGDKVELLKGRAILCLRNVRLVDSCNAGHVTEDIALSSL